MLFCTPRVQTEPVIGLFSVAIAPAESGISNPALLVGWSVTFCLLTRREKTMCDGACQVVILNTLADALATFFSFTRLLYSLVVIPKAFTRPSTGRYCATKTIHLRDILLLI